MSHRIESHTDYMNGGWHYHLEDINDDFVGDNACVYCDKSIGGTIWGFCSLKCMFKWAEKEKDYDLMNEVMIKELTNA